LLTVILSNFTGYLLPWDQLAYWAITVSTSMLEYIPLAGSWLMNIVRGGSEVNAATLLNFYTFHTGILPVTLIILMIFHFWRVRKAKGIALPGNTAEYEKVPSNPNLVARELVVGLVLIAFILFLSVFFNAPLLERANPAYSPNPAKAPWYFMGVQELLLHFHPLIASVIIPFAFFIGMFWLPYIPFSEYKPGQWFGTSKGKKLAVRSAWLALALTPLAVLADEYLLDFEGWMQGIPILISSGLVPLLILLITIYAYIKILIKRYNASRVEWIIALFTVIVVSYSILTIIGIWFRGPGMKLILPWSS
jgi:quinol-cytochrome oxidoreductase complex cytochrome b subunit